MSLLILGSCTSGWEDMNRDPNNPTTVKAGNVLVAVERASTSTLFDVWWTGNNTTSYANQIVKIQYIDENWYNERDGIIQRWSTLMTYQVELNKIVAIAQASGDTGMEGAALVLKAQLFHIMTDTWEAIPFTQGARCEEGILQPEYDSQESVYTALLEMLKSANTLLGAAATDADYVIDGDALNGGDPVLWQKYANSLRLRMAIRMSNVAPAAAKTVIDEIVGSPATYPILESNDDMIAFEWVGVSPYYEPFYDDKVNNARDDHAVCKTFIDNLLTINDPRISEFAHLCDATPQIYKGLTAGVDPTENYNLDEISRIGTRYRDLATGASYYMRYAEVEFLLAEAYARADLLNDAVEAKAHYEAGITASCEEHGVAAGDITTFIAGANVNWDDATGSFGYSNLQKIYYQKWISLFKQGHEAWAETRRTDIPQLSAAPGSIFPGHTRPPFRWPYPTDEYSLNKTNVELWDGAIVDRFWGDQMWWDTRTGVE